MLSSMFKNHRNEQALNGNNDKNKHIESEKVTTKIIYELVSYIKLNENVLYQKIFSS